MTTLTYPYYLTDTSILRPYVPIYLSESNLFSGVVDALIDSGAEDTIFNIDTATAMGINLDNCDEESVYLGNQKCLGKVKNLNLQVQNFNSFVNIRAIFIKELSIAGILGQHDFFENYRVSFYRHGNSFSISDSPHLTWPEHDALTDLFK